MMDDSVSPIIVTGPGRSGSTWMQWFLSRHPRIHIHGQSPRIPWQTFWTWWRTMLEEGEWAEQANQRIGYDIAHYAGSDSHRSAAVFRRYFRDFMCGFGPRKPRWGLKWIGLCERSEEIDQFSSLWPEARYVVCIRNPFVTINSFKNTFAPDLDPREYAAKWVTTCAFVESRRGGRLMMVQMDKLREQTEQERRAAMRNLMHCIGEQPCGETDAFLGRWDIVHKVKPDAKRSFQLSAGEKQVLIDEVPGLARYMDKHGYRIN